MVTTVGTGKDVQTVVTNLIQLERDAIAAYESTIEKLSNSAASAKIEEFRQDHLRHLRELEDAARECGAEIPADTDAKAMLTQGKVAIAALGSDDTILSAMSTNENDTIAAYRNSCENSVMPASMRPMLERALKDEERHKAWMDSAAA
ncbi:ferritin-like domain-containing protein [Jannaschia formosa]|uniref:ferritin-like domain-containing protein n=1 Tax=Jannaschia formosa TaxID=2259592 RepID=UPI000E1B6A5C|nr:ferritin-like domain-containing protein [Jannaschia formosa]TFL19874.1 ferritin-like domain-containing protein [Jannaschia formosa]